MARYGDAHAAMAVARSLQTASHRRCQRILPAHDGLACGVGIAR